MLGRARLKHSSLRHVSCWTRLQFALLRGEVPLSYPEGDVDQPDKCRYFNERADYTHERLARLQAKDGHGHRNRQLEVVAGSREGKGSGLRVVGAEPLAHPKAHQKHDEEINDQRDCDANHIERQAHNQIALEREHHQDREEQGGQRERTDPGDEARAIPLLAFEPNESKACNEPGDEWNAEVDCNALRDLGDADLHDASFKAEPLGKHGNEDPRVKAVKEHLKDAVDCDQAGNVVRVTVGQLIPDQDHRDTACDADQDESAHIGGGAAKEHDGQEEHEHRPDDPVLDQRQRENSFIAKELTHPLVSNFRQRREHHDDQPDCDRDIRRSTLKAIDESRGTWDEVAYAHSNGHCEEYPEREEAVEEGELLPLQRSANPALHIGFVGHCYVASRAIGYWFWLAATMWRTREGFIAGRCCRALSELRDAPEWRAANKETDRCGGLGSRMRRERHGLSPQACP